MKILIENSGYRLTNLGDLAMLQVSISRLINLWPDAHIDVLTLNSDLLKKFCPEVHPINPSPLTWLPYLLPQKFHRLTHQSGSDDSLSKFEWEVHQQLPILTHPILKRRLQKIKNNNSPLFESIENADLIVASGGGYITDYFEYKANETLEILNLAKWLGKPVVMLGHGLGPLQKPELRKKAKIVLPRLDLISLRESKAGVPLLDDLGVPKTRMVTTGDDAIELAYNSRKTEIGDGIGINLRVTGYSNVGVEALEAVRFAIQSVAREKKVSLIPIPIANRQTEDDPQAIRQLLAGYDEHSDGGQNLDTPLKVIEQVAHCRVVVTGSYHAGVFALSQGIPVISLAKSQYYVDKFSGLAEQFGVGCQVISLESPQFKEKLIYAIKDSWEQAPNVRKPLLEAAQKQIDLGHKTYQRVYHIAESMKK